MGNSVLRWAGSKKRILSKLKNNIPEDYERYVELFAGSACLFFSLKPRESILNDINFELINFYRALINCPDEIGEKLNSFNKNKELYYKIRAIDSSSLKNNTNRAVRFLYLNRCCFNGVYRTNMKGQFNVPYGTRTGAFPTIEELHAFSEKLKKAKLFSKDFEELYDKINGNDFVYLDPPYYKTNKQELYGINSLKESDISRFIDFTKSLNEKNVKVLISYKYDEDFRKEYKSWNCKLVSNQRSIEGFSKRKNVEELLIKNY